MTEEKKVRFEALKKKDENSSREIARQNKKLEKLQVCKQQCAVKYNHLTIIIAHVHTCTVIYPGTANQDGLQC